MADKKGRKSYWIKLDNIKFVQKQAESQDRSESWTLDKLIEAAKKKEDKNVKHRS